MSAITIVSRAIIGLMVLPMVLSVIEFGADTPVASWMFRMLASVNLQSDRGVDRGHDRSSEHSIER